MKIKLIVLFSLIFTSLIAFQFYSNLPTQHQPEVNAKTTGLVMKIPRYYWPGTFWTDIASSKGWFKEAGLNVEIIDTNADYFASITDTVEGKIDVNNFTLFDVISYNLKGSDLVGVISGDYSNGAEAIVAKKSIDNIKALQGKTIGVSKGTYLEYILRAVISLNELDIKTLTFLDMPGEKALEIFKRANVDAIVSWEPEITHVLSTGQAKKIFDTSQIPGISPSLFAFHRKFLETRPGDVQAYVDVWHRTNQFIQANPKKAFAIIAKIYHVSEKAVKQLARTDKILTLQDNLHAFSYSPGFKSLHRVAYKMNAFLVERELANTFLDTSTLFDDRFIRNLK
jgi:NitT/TauT family transport system substrate-binding protein